MDLNKRYLPPIFINFNISKRLLKGQQFPSINKKCATLYFESNMQGGIPFFPMWEDHSFIQADIK